MPNARIPTAISPKAQGGNGTSSASEAAPDEDIEPFCATNGKAMSLPISSALEASMVRALVPAAIPFSVNVARTMLPLCPLRSVCGFAEFARSILPGVAKFITGLSFAKLKTPNPALITETMFAWPGVGRMAVGAITSSDFPLAQGAILILAIGFLSVNLIVDVLYAWLDPRIGTARS